MKHKLYNHNHVTGHRLAASAVASSIRQNRKHFDKTVCIYDAMYVHLK